LPLRPPRVVVAASGRRSVCVHESKEKVPSRHLAGAPLRRAYELGVPKGHHHGTARQRRVRLRPHACTGEGRHGGAISSCVASSGRHRRMVHRRLLRLLSAAQWRERKGSRTSSGGTTPHRRRRPPRLPPLSRAAREREGEGRNELGFRGTAAMGAF